MKYFTNFFQGISNKVKALYLVWFFIHFILLLISGNGLSKFHRDFYPFDTSTYYVTINFNIREYDYSEFLIYTLSPIFIYLIFYLWWKK